jgi:RHS repeat-associated protein
MEIPKWKSNGAKIDQDKANGKTKDHTNNGKDKNVNENGNGKANGKNKIKENQGKHLGWYKNGNISGYPDAVDFTNPEIFEVTNYINDPNQEYTQVLMTADVDRNYRGVYTYANGERLSVEDLVEVEGTPNNPLYYLSDALGSTTAITNMNAGIIDNNRFAPFGEALSPVAKNSRLTNSPWGYTGESHDIEAGLVYLRARYYEPETGRFIQQDSYPYFGEIEQPLSRNLYAYSNNNPIMNTDPSGHSSKPYDITIPFKTSIKSLHDIRIAISKEKRFKYYAEFSQYATYRIDDNCGEIIGIKGELSELGYKNGDSTPVFNSVLKRQVTDFQLKYGLIPSSQINLGTLNMIHYAYQLKIKGYDKEAIDKYVNLEKGVYSQFYSGGKNITPSTRIYSQDEIEYFLNGEERINYILYEGLSNSGIPYVETFGTIGLIGLDAQYGNDPTSHLGKLAKNVAIDYYVGKILKIAGKYYKVLKGSDEVVDVSKVAVKTLKLSESNIKHIGKHIPDEFAKQASYLTDVQLAKKLSNTSFFNPKWSKQQVLAATEQAYNALRNKGLTGLQSYKVNGEVIKVFIKSDGTFDTAYGLHKLTIEFFRK